MQPASSGKRRACQPATDDTDEHRADEHSESGVVGTYVVFDAFERARTPDGRELRRVRVARAGRGELLFGTYLVAMNVSNALQSWRAFGGGAPGSPLYGIWTVDQMAIDGVVRPALITDTERWRRVIFDWPGVLAYQRMNDTLEYESVAVDPEARRISRTGRGEAAVRAELPAANTWMQERPNFQ